MTEDKMPTILLVEDDAIIAAAEALVLRRNGYGVYTAHSGVEAVEAMAARPSIDLVLMDVDLGPGMDGPQAAEIILRRRSLPILFLSSHTEPEVVARTERITSSGYVVKNSGETVLLASIRMAFKLHAAQLQAQLKAQQLERSNEELAQANRKLEAALVERERAEAALRSREAEFRGLFEASPLPAAMLVKPYFRKVNPVFCRTLGYAEEELIGQSTGMIFEDRDECARVGRQLDEGMRAIGRGATESRLRRKDETVIDAVISASPMDRYSPDGPAGIAVLIQDITEAKRRFEDLRQTEHFSERAQEIGRIGPFVLDIVDIGRPELQTWRSTPTMEAMFGIDAQFPRTGRSWLDLIVQRDEIERILVHDVVGRGQPFESEYQIIRPCDGARRWISSRGELEYDEEGRPVRLIGTVQDITERREVSALLSQSLHAKELQFHELYHRVKNSLVTILSLLNLEMDQIEGGAARDALAELGDRILSIEKLYELLMRSGSGTSIKLDEYLRSIVDSLREAYARDEAIAFRTRLVAFESDVTSATAIGIILNELLTNALKYAFPDGRRGSITISLESSETELTLGVSDDGSELPADFSLDGGAGLGLQIVRALALQMGGQLRLGIAGRKAFSVSVPRPGPTQAEAQART